MDPTQAEKVGELRRRTGWPIHTCVKALDITDGDVEKAATLLTETVVDAWDPDERRRFWEQFKTQEKH